MSDPDHEEVGRASNEADPLLSRPSPSASSPPTPQRSRRHHVSTENKAKVTHARGLHHFNDEEKNKMNKFQSLDFQPIDSQIFREYERHAFMHENLTKTFGKWVLCFVIGGVIGLLAYGIKHGVEFLQDLHFSTAAKYMAQGNVSAAFLFSCAWCAVLAGSACAVIIILRQPMAGGSGIPEVKAYLNGVRVPGSLNVVTLIGKILSLVLSYASGLVLGPEGPMIHLGSMIGGAIGQVKSKTMKCYPSMFWKYHNDRDRRDFIASGAAAGVAAAFGAPIGGILFSLEEAASFWHPTLTIRTFFCCLTAVFLSSMLVQENIRQMNQQGMFVFGLSSDYLYRVFELIPFTILGAVGGLFGALFVHLNIRLSTWRMNSLKSWQGKILEIVLVAVITTAICFGLPALFPCRVASDITPVPNADGGFAPPANNTLVTLFCEDRADDGTGHARTGMYNDIASLLFTPPDKALQLLYNRSNNIFSVGALATASGVYFILTTITSGVALASGLFIPMMLVGAAGGRLIGTLLQQGFPTWQPPLDPSVYALVGSSAMMAGFSRMSISLVVIMVELTQGTQYLLPIMLSVMIAKWIGDIFNEAQYEHLMELKVYPYLGWQPPHYAAFQTVADVMAKEVVTLRAIESVRNLVHVLRTTEHHGFPVCDPPPQGSYSDRGVMPPSPSLSPPARRVRDDRNSVNSGSETFASVLEDARDDGDDDDGDGDDIDVGPPRRNGVFKGIILRNQISVLLRSKIFVSSAQLLELSQQSPVPLPATVVFSKSRSAEMVDLSQIEVRHPYPVLKWEEFSKMMARELPDIDALSLSAEQMGMYIDLRPYMNRSPALVQQTHSLTETYRLFRTMGLRHVVVLDETHHVAGMVTRKDLL
eukprot:TRINITY_DN3802_c0_g1_i2.p1 TRINITY_DN3802_c0_g1~~TRINITY_DN3802_c0_g1_i2.p1  ORF type:complete len:885 (+),score=157.27 TRINITY_DN3802_c0_g1_i2:34-2655(+)